MVIIDGCDAIFIKCVCINGLWLGGSSKVTTNNCILCYSHWAEQWLHTSSCCPTCQRPFVLRFATPNTSSLEYHTSHSKILSLLAFAKSQDLKYITLAISKLSFHFYLMQSSRILDLQWIHKYLFSYDSKHNIIRAIYTLISPRHALFTMFCEIQGLWSTDISTSLNSSPNISFLTNRAISSGPKFLYFLFLFILTSCTSRLRLKGFMLSVFTLK